MPSSVNGGGDQLARGAVRVQFRNASGVTEEQYNEATKGFDLKRFLSGESNNSDTSSEAPGITGVDSGEAVGRGICLDQDIG